MPEKEVALRITTCSRARYCTIKEKFKMKIRTLLLSAAILLSLAATGLSQAKAEKGFKTIFDGKTFDGWKKAEENPDTWSIKDGAFVAAGPRNHLYYVGDQEPFVDFELKIDVMTEPGSNGGVYFHTDFKPGTVDVSQGMQFEIDRTLNHHTGGLYGDGRQWIAWPSPEFEQVIRPTDWNDFLLKVEGNHMVAVLNGVTILDFTDPTPKSSDGYIALQLHSGGLGNMRFKDIYVRDMSAR